jgi:hypothetical protein
MYYPSSYSGVCTLLHLNCPTGIENDAGTAKSPFANPGIRKAGGRIDFSNVAGCEINLFNLQGKKVLSVNPRSALYVLETGLVPYGLYCAKVTSNNRIIALRMINVLQ